MKRIVKRIVRRAWASIVVGVGVVAWSVACAQIDATDTASASEPRSPFSFAIVRTATAGSDPDTAAMLRAIGDGPSRFIVHFEGTTPSNESCADRGLDRRRALLDTSAKPVVPIVATSEWADCGTAGSDSVERLERTADTLFGGDESLGQARLPWLRQSALPRFKRYRENLLWQSGLVLFAVLNLPDNNNGYRVGAGRNGEFEERLVANRAWLARTFRLANERKLSGIVLFIDAAPHFTLPLRAPDNRLRERDGYYEFKLSLREFVTTFKGQVLLVQGHRGPAATVATAATGEPDHPLRDGTGKAIDNFTRVVSVDPVERKRWLRVDVDPARRGLFRVASERLFDDPSGELYGTARPR